MTPPQPSEIHKSCLEKTLNVVYVRINNLEENIPSLRNFLFKQSKAKGTGREELPPAWDVQNIIY